MADQMLVYMEDVDSEVCDSFWFDVVPVEGDVINVLGWGDSVPLGGKEWQVVKRVITPSRVVGLDGGNRIDLFVKEVV